MRSPPHVPDTAPHAATLPVPTVTTPISAPSPSHAPPSPEPIPIPGSSVDRRRRDNNEPIHPIPIHGPIPSPSHPPVSIPPDGWVPYANSAEDITLPPPHELSRPVSPASSNHSLPDTRAPPVAPVNNSTMHVHNIANPSSHDPYAPSNASVPFSPQSKTSTHISDYDLVSRPSESRSSSRHGTFERLLHAPRTLQTVVERATTPSRRSREDVGPIEGLY